MPRKPKNITESGESITEEGQIITDLAPNITLANTAELLGDGANPRKISDEASAGLKASLRRFGDLSGIVFNRRTGELVAGHQRMKQIRAEYGDRDIEAIDEAAGLFGIRIDAEHFFQVRVVDWTKAKQRAANVAANNTKIAGSFTSDLSNFLLSVEAELSAELPGVLEECLMVDLMAAGLDTTEAKADPEETETVEFEAGNNVEDPTLRFQVVVECRDEEHQVELLNKFEVEGLKCRALIS